jgi:hypothetical protein
MKQRQRVLRRSVRIHGSVLKLQAPYRLVIATSKLAMFHLTGWSMHRLGVEFHFRGNWLRWGIRSMLQLLVLELH